MTRQTDKLRDALRNARFEAQKRTDQAGVRDDPEDSPVFDRARRNRKSDQLIWDTARAGEEDSDIY